MISSCGIYRFLSAVPFFPAAKRGKIALTNGRSRPKEGAASVSYTHLFGALLLRMYTRYAERHRFRVEPVSYNMTELGGVKEAVFTIVGEGEFSRLKFESGVHRVQRVPSTDSGGRIHTSTCTVAVLPEVEDLDVTIDPKEMCIRDSWTRSPANLKSGCPKSWARALTRS